jgi:endonuclease/exonuclease/phosphatase family metal-dependent hydrolase
VRRGILAAAVLAAALELAAARPALPVGRPLCGTARGAPAPAEPALTVATFNVLHGLEETPSYPASSTLDARLELAARALAGAGVDAAGLQEVSLTEGSRLHRPGLVVRRLAARLAALTGEAWHWCWHLANPHVPVEPELRPGGGGPLSDLIARQASENDRSFKEGAAVLSRYPIAAAEARRLPLRFPAEYVACPPRQVPTCTLTAVFDHRVALWARLETPGGPTDLIATHLAHDITRFSDVSATEQAAAVAAFADEMTLRFGRPARRLIACDCNNEPSDRPSVAALLARAGWVDAYPATNPHSRCAPPADRSACTADQDILAPAPTVTERIDYVFARAGSCPLRLARGRKVADRPSPAPTRTGFLWPSDHHGVAVDIDLLGCLGR